MLEANLARVSLKYGPKLQLLEQQLNSEDGLLCLPSAPLTEEQRQALLFGRLFQGVGKPLKGPRNQTPVDSPRAFVTRHKILNGQFTPDVMQQPLTREAIKTARTMSLFNRFGLVRIGFIRRHVQSIRQRWMLNQHSRPALFPGSPVYYLLGL